MLTLIISVLFYRLRDQDYIPSLILVLVMTVIIDGILIADLISISGGCQ